MSRATRQAHGLRSISLSRLIGAIALTLAIGWVCSVFCVIGFAEYDSAGEADVPRADAIIVLGAAQYAGRPSPVLRSRIDHAIALWKSGAGRMLVFTGGMGTGDTTSEAMVSRVYARKQGIPDSVIVLETVGRTTSASMHAVAALLRAQHARSVLLVSDPFHMFRIWILAHRVGLSPRTSPTRTSPIAANIGSNLGYIFSESVKAPVTFLIK